MEPPVILPQWNPWQRTPRPCYLGMNHPCIKCVISSSGWANIFKTQRCVSSSPQTRHLIPYLPQPDHAQPLPLRHRTPSASHPNFSSCASHFTRSTGSCTHTDAPVTQNVDIRNARPQIPFHLPHNSRHDLALVLHSMQHISASCSPSRIGTRMEL